MTSPQTAYALAMIAAAQARIAGMQATNQERLSLGHSIAYDADAFYNEATDLEQIAQSVIQQS